MSPQERLAHNFDLRYHSRYEGGHIGLISNGSGASMALDSLISTYGGKTANYLDLYGDSAFEDMQEAFHLVEFDSRVKCILVNTFGGIFNIATMIEALVNEKKKGILTKPIVLRMKGYHLE